MKTVTTFTASILLATFIQGCAVQKQLVPTGGSRADGTVKLSYEYGMFEAPKLDGQQGLTVAQQRCSAWGYKGGLFLLNINVLVIHLLQINMVRWNRL